MKVLTGKWISFGKFLNILLICFCFVGFATAQKTEEMPKQDTSEHSNHAEHSEHSKDNLNEENNKIPKLTFPDIEVQTQDGSKVNFFKDLIKGKKVFISFVYTSCNLTCPMVGRNFEKLQKAVGEDLGKDIFLISVTTDPETDTPQVLKTWGEKFNRENGWTLVTGNKSEMENLLMTLTGSGPQRGLHTSLLILFDEASGNWDTSSSLLSPKTLVDKLNALGEKTAK